MTEVKHFLKKALLLLPLPLAFFATNYFVDPANLFQGGKYEKNLAQSLVEGHNVTGLLNYDERILQEKFISGLKVRPDWLVLGSSHTMQIHESYMPGTLINNSVSGCVFEDLLAICELHEKNKGLPKHIVICVDPWLFNANTGEESWEPYAEAYQDMCRRIGIKEIKDKPVSHRKILELFSPDYFRNACDFLIRGKNRKFTVVDSSENHLETRLSDGSLVYDKWVREADTIHINQKAGFYLKNQPIFMIWEYKELSPEIEKNFGKLLDYLQNKGSDLYFFLPPYHPIVQNYLNRHTKEYGIITSVEQYVSELASQRHIPLIGSYDPRKLHLSAADFYDGTHCKTAIMDSLVGSYVRKHSLK